MTYTQHRDTQDTLAVIESLDLDGDPPTQEEVNFMEINKILKT